MFKNLSGSSKSSLIPRYVTDKINSEIEEEEQRIRSELMLKKGLNRLNRDELFVVFSYFDVPTLVHSISMVCKEWRSVYIIKEEIFWKQLHGFYFGDSILNEKLLKSNKKEKKETEKSYFRRLYDLVFTTKFTCSKSRKKNFRISRNFKRAIPSKNKKLCLDLNRKIRPGEHYTLRLRLKCTKIPKKNNHLWVSFGFKTICNHHPVQRYQFLVHSYSLSSNYRRNGSTDTEYTLRGNPKNGYEPWKFEICEALKSNGIVCEATIDLRNDEDRRIGFKMIDSISEFINIPKAYERNKVVGSEFTPEISFNNSCICWEILDPKDD